MYFNDQNTQFPLLQTEPRKLYEELRGGRKKWEEGPKDQNISKSHSNTSLTLKKVHLVLYCTSTFIQ